MGDGGSGSHGKNADASGNLTANLLVAPAILPYNLPMITRQLQPPERSFFLFGARGTGKTTWLRQCFKNALWFDLLRMETVLQIQRDPTWFRKAVEALPAGSWTVVDEVQRLPALLNEVHSLIADHGRKFRFALSGSSARKLKRMDVNLLAGRAINRTFFPFTASELQFDVDVNSILKFGLLPQVVTEQKHAVEFLDAYVANYLREEIREEAVVRSLDAFSRFLDVAARMNGQTINMTSLARDVATPRATVQGYFSILEDTLLGNWLPAWQQRARVKEVASPKFYFFDPGVVRALSGQLRETLDPMERGFLFETWIFHELRAATSFLNCGGQLYYWRTPHGTEVDFIWSRGKRAVGIEVKCATNWRGEFGASLRALLETKSIQSGFVVYLGNLELKDGPVRALPVRKFLELLSAGEILPA